MSASQPDPIRPIPALLSLVVPLYNEIEVLAELHARCVAALEPLCGFEMICVDDGSSDGTRQALRDLAAADSRVRGVLLSRNFGHQAALTAGLEAADGAVIVTMDADLQDPPELIGELLEEWRRGGEIVSATRRSRAGESRIKLATASGFYGAFGRLSGIDLSEQTGDYRLYDRRALEALSSMHERSRFLRGMSAWIGFDQRAIEFDREPRFAGETKFTPRRMIRFSFDAISSFSHLPLQLATLLGFVFSILAFLAIPIAIGLKLAGQFVPGITTVLLAVLLLGGIQLITVGIIGEYLGRVYDEVKARPLYIVSELTDRQ